MIIVSNTSPVVNLYWLTWCYYDGKT